jgi:Resolvase, N terminal domain
VSVGHARVSTPDQRLEVPTDHLRAAGCDRIFTDVACGANADRPQLAAALDYARAGDDRQHRRDLQCMILGVVMMGANAEEHAGTDAHAPTRSGIWVLADGILMGS